jgi:hypothetical protein
VPYLIAAIASVAGVARLTSVRVEGTIGVLKKEIACSLSDLGNRRRNVISNMTF